jgi:hypothetical protein
MGILSPWDRLQLKNIKKNLLVPLMDDYEFILISLEGLVR